jgi:prolipoprotein diacylglyceryltransferase
MPVAFYLPWQVPVYASSLLLGLGASLGLAWAAWGVDEEFRLKLLDAGLLVLLGGLVGGRTAFVAAHWTYFSSHLIEIPQISLGGMSGAGALAGGGLVLVLLSWNRRVPEARSQVNAARLATGLESLGDSLLPMLVTLSVCAWLACWLDGCAYGETTGAWWGVPARDETGAIARRVPLQLIGASLTLVWFAAIGWDFRRGLRLGANHGTRRKERNQGARGLTRSVPGLKTGLGLLGFSLQLLGVSFLRADAGLIWRSLRLDSWAEIALAALAVLDVIMVCVRDAKERKRKDEKGTVPL